MNMKELTSTIIGPKPLLIYGSWNCKSVCSPSFQEVLLKDGIERIVNNYQQEGNAENAEDAEN